MSIQSLLQISFHAFREGRFEQAKVSLGAALSLEPNNLKALEILGIIAAKEGDSEKAISWFQRIVDCDPTSATGWSNLGNIYKNLNQPDKALLLFEKAIHIDPSLVIALINKGLIFYELKKYDQALICFEKIINLRPGYAEAWCDHGNALRELKQYEKALISYERAVQLSPNFAQAWSNRGVTLKQLGRQDEAMTSYARALRLKPDLCETWKNQGNLLLELGQYQRALASYDKAVELCPRQADSWLKRARTLIAVGFFEQAEIDLRKAFQLGQQNPGLTLHERSDALFNLNYFDSHSPEYALREARHYGAVVTDQSKPKFFHRCESESITQLKIGFVSGDIKNHSVCRFFEGLIEQLDRNQFLPIVFPTSNTVDELTTRIRRICHDWVPIYAMSDEEAAKLIHQRGIHILIDLSGHTADNRLSVFGYKPAPIQASWLGYFATTGMPEIDYFLGDPYISPEVEWPNFTEKIWNLKETWFCMKPPTSQLTESQLPALSNDFLTFGSFGNLSKMNDQVVQSWASVLSRVPASKLLLKSKQLADPWLAESVRQRFKKHDIASEQLILEGPQPRMAYLAAYNRVDFVLDTFPYPGGTTSVDSLWMGVPVLTIEGNRFLSRLGKSIAVNAGLMDWIAQGREDYVDKAVTFASDLSRLAEIRQNLRRRIPQSPLFDTPSFAKHFGEALWGMWRERPK